MRWPVLAQHSPLRFALKLGVDDLAVQRPRRNEFSRRLLLLPSIVFEMYGLMPLLSVFVSPPLRYGAV